MYNGLFVVYSVTVFMIVLLFCDEHTLGPKTPRIPGNPGSPVSP